MTKKLKDGAVERIPQMRILHILSDQDKSLRPLENLVFGLDRHIFSQVICYLGGDEDKHSKFEAWGHNVISLDISKRELRRFRPSIVFRLARIIQKQGIDIVHCQLHKPTVLSCQKDFSSASSWMAVSSHCRLCSSKELFSAVYSRFSSFRSVPFS